MDVMVIGVVRMSGKSKETGNPYDFTTLHYLKPVDPVGKESFQLRGYGYEVSKAEVINDAFERFSQLVYPCRVELIVDTVPGRNGFRLMVIGFKPAQNSKAA